MRVFTVLVMQLFRVVYAKCVYRENTSDKWDIPWYTIRKCCITILYHAMIENTVANTINGTYMYTQASL